MKYLKAVILFLSFLILSSSCSEDSAFMVKSQEVCQYIEKSSNLNKRFNLNLDIDNGNVEIYIWKKDEIGFDIKKCIRGPENKDVLLKKMKDIEIDYGVKDNLVYCISKNKGKKSISKSISLKLFMPQKIMNMDCKIRTGKIKIYDDINCSLTMAVKNADTEINSLRGKICFKGDKCNFRINGGELAPDSYVKLNRGNIFIHAAITGNSVYDFRTKVGNLLLELPENSKIRFNSEGLIIDNEFSSEESVTEISLKTGMGKVIVKKY